MAVHTDVVAPLCPFSSVCLQYILCVYFQCNIQCSVIIYKIKSSLCVGYKISLDLYHIEFTCYTIPKEEVQEAVSKEAKMYTH